MQGTQLVDVPFQDEPSLETIHDNLLIGDADTVAEKLVREIQAAKPVHIITPSSTVRRIVNMTALAVVDAGAQRGEQKPLL